MDQGIEHRPQSTPNPAKSRQKHRRTKRVGSGDRSFSLDSTGDSTRSLLSVLSHSSVDSISSGSISDDEETKDSDRQLEDTQTHDSEGEGNEHHLSAWEEWLIRKEQEDRVNVKKQLRDEERKKQEEEEKRREKEKLHSKAKEKYTEWVEEKNMREQMRMKSRARKEQIQIKLKEEEKRKIEEKSKENFDDWIEKKKEQEQARKEKEKQMKLKEEEEKKNKQAKAEEKYNEWKNQTRNRPKPQKSSFGYTSGILTGYYDAGAYPIPSFYNPMPWQPIAVPKPKATKKNCGRGKSKPKRVSEPSPPLLFKARAHEDNLTIWGRPR
ncbi:uncharacterized protein LOC144452846 [Glandiceps talaboti]